MLISKMNGFYEGLLLGLVLGLFIIPKFNLILFENFTFKDKNGYCYQYV